MRLRIEKPRGVTASQPFDQLSATTCVVPSSTWHQKAKKKKETTLEGAEGFATKYQIERGTSVTKDIGRSRDRHADNEKPPFCLSPKEQDTETPAHKTHYSLSREAHAFSHASREAEGGRRGEERR